MWADVNWLNKHIHFIKFSTTTDPSWTNVFQFSVPLCNNTQNDYVWLRTLLLISHAHVKWWLIFCSKRNHACAPPKFCRKDNYIMPLGTKRLVPDIQCPFLRGQAYQTQPIIPSCYIGWCKRHNVDLWRYNYISSLAPVCPPFFSSSFRTVDLCYSSC